MSFSQSINDRIGDRSRRTCFHADLYSVMYANLIPALVGLLFTVYVIGRFLPRQNVFVRNVTVGQCREAVLRINLQYENREKCKRGFDPIVRNVHLKNVTCEKSKLGVLIIGLEDDKHVYNISVEDSHFNNVAKGVNDIKGAKDVTFKNLYINGELVK